MAVVSARKNVDPAEVRAAVLAIADWLDDQSQPTPPRPALAAAVRLTARTLETVAPGNSVEVRVPPFVAVQCVEGPRHTRGTPPNVVEMSPRVWLLLATGLLDFDDAVADGRVDASGHRAGAVSQWLPIVPLR
ncbi:sterol carrier family protein [Gordonia sp. ABSL1-1]|uniref:sterol carrier family protein n=1 Tax=Gordonia sp. ABSL1-1 TaxID=3053923 RepID=UPI002572C704|nr:sterol carrier family protein [Gordonia sp. ABSL1-1]MDL9936173.1 sterol carrier family protein [Gordonia sp. ABSL1-1]